MFQQNRVVEAIEDGQIVSVSEDYALREGLPIIRKQEIDYSQKQLKKMPLDEMRLGFDDFRKPLKPKKINPIVKSLIKNYHWEVSRKRRQMGISRVKFAQMLGENENRIKLLEAGVLDDLDFILINKVQESLGVSLLKGSEEDFGEMRKLVEKSSSRVDFSSNSSEKNIQNNRQNISGDEIELID